ncbi:hypothetical protein SUNI508_02379 [Seiridium unicorne]|uniref:Fungal N-terminal domain-containing protein n=1 Tax=Seiridium unicorne TaxID=138068 RepID=A0ABR2UI16_9PEZI
MATGIDVVSAIQTVGSMGYQLYQFFSSLKDAPEEIRNMCVELQLLQGLLPRIGQSVSALSSARSVNLDITFVCLRGCESEFKRVWAAVEPLCTNRGMTWGNFMAKLTKSLKLVLKREEIEKFTKSLERSKLSLVLSMMYAGIQVDSSTPVGLSSIESKIDENGFVLESQLKDIHTTIIFQLRQLENRILQTVKALSESVAQTHFQSDQKINELHDRIIPDEPSQTTSLPLAQAGTSTGAKLSTIKEINGNGSGSPLHEAKLKNPEAFVMAEDSEEAHLLSQWRKAVIHFRLSPQYTRTQLSEKTGMETSLYSMDDISNWILQTTREIDSSLVMKLSPGIEALGGLSHRTAQDSKYSELAFVTAEALIQVARLSSRLEPGLIIGALVEMQEAIEVGSREYELYPEPKMKTLIHTLHVDSFKAITSMLELFTRSRVFEKFDPHGRLQDDVAKIKQSSQRVIREAEYMQRKEFRQAHVRLCELDKKQNQIIQAVEEQRKLLVSLRDEHKALDIIADHQQVLQMLQQLLSRFPLSSSAELYPSTEPEAGST